MTDHSVGSGGVVAAGPALRSRARTEMTFFDYVNTSNQVGDVEHI